jgi:D-3-phosphoglycerate dehydrogenase
MYGVNDSGYLIVITDSESDSFEIELNEAKKIGAVLRRYDCRTEDEVIEASKEADAVLVDLAPITRRVIQALTKCRVIVRYGIGLDNIDIDAATEAGIYVVNIPTYCIEEVSTHAVALALTCVRKILHFDRDVKAGIWDFQRQMPILGLNDCRVGVVAFGNIARLFVKKMIPFGPEIVVNDPFVPDETIRGFGAIPVDFDELVRTSDIISLHAPLAPQTRHLFGEEQFKIMKPNAYLINTARGGLIDEKALYPAIAEGWIAGAALDTTDPEPPEGGNPLLTLDNVIFTPHAAFYSETSLKQLHQIAIEEAVRVLKGDLPTVIVNKGVVPRGGCTK